MHIVVLVGLLTFMVTAFGDCKMVMSEMVYKEKVKRGHGNGVSVVEGICTHST